MRKARDVSYRRKFDLKQVEKAQNKRQWILLGVVLSLLACLADCRDYCCSNKALYAA